MATNRRVTGRLSPEWLQSCARTGRLIFLVAVEADISGFHICHLKSAFMLHRIQHIGDSFARRCKRVRDESVQDSSEPMRHTGADLPEETINMNFSLQPPLKHRFLPQPSFF